MTANLRFLLQFDNRLGVTGFKQIDEGIREFLRGNRAQEYADFERSVESGHYDLALKSYELLRTHPQELRKCEDILGSHLKAQISQMQRLEGSLSGDAQRQDFLDHFQCLRRIEFAISVFDEQRDEMGGNLFLQREQPRVQQVQTSKQSKKSKSAVGLHQIIGLQDIYVRSIQKLNHVLESILDRIDQAIKSEDFHICMENADLAQNIVSIFDNNGEQEVIQPEVEAQIIQQQQVNKGIPSYLYKQSKLRARGIDGQIKAKLLAVKQMYEGPNPQESSFKSFSKQIARLEKVSRFVEVQDFIEQIKLIVKINLQQRIEDWTDERNLQRIIWSMPSDLKEELEEEFRKKKTSIEQQIVDQAALFPGKFRSGEAKQAVEILLKLQLSGICDKYDSLVDIASTELENQRQNLQATSNNTGSFQKFKDSYFYLKKYWDFRDANQDLWRQMGTTAQIFDDKLFQAREQVRERIEKCTFGIQNLLNPPASKMDTQSSSRLEENVSLLEKMLEAGIIEKTNPDMVGLIIFLGDFIRDYQKKHLQAFSDPIKLNNLLILLETAKFIQNVLPQVLEISDSDTNVKTYVDIKEQVEAIIRDKIKAFEQPLPFYNKEYSIESSRNLFYKEMNLIIEFIKQLGQIKGHNIFVEVDNQQVQLFDLSNVIAKTFEGNVKKPVQDIIQIVQQNNQTMADYSKLDEIYTHLVSQRDNIHLKCCKECPFIREIEDLIQAELNRIEENFKRQTGSQLHHLAASLAKMKQIGDQLQALKGSVTDKIDELINETCLIKSIKLEDNVNLNSLAAELERIDDVSARHLMQEHSYFYESLIAQKNKDIHKTEYGFKYIINNLQGKGFNEGSVHKIINYCWSSYVYEAKNIDKKLLEDGYGLFEQIYGVYDSKANRFSGLLQNLTSNPTTDELVATTKKISAHPLSYDQRDKTIITLIAHVFAVWTFKSAEELGKKSLNNNTRSLLMQPHPAQVIAIFRILGLCNSQKNLKFEFENHLAQVKTGEGKSLIIAVLSIVLALLGMNVYCACYSKNLSQRDNENFQGLIDAFQLKESIKYGTLDEICELQINKHGDIRKLVLQQLCNQKQKVIYTKNKKEDQPAILIIDEVDMFFAKSFFGQGHQPFQLLQDELINKLIIKIYDERANYLKKNNGKGKILAKNLLENHDKEEFSKFILKTDEYKQIALKYQQIIKIIENAVQQLAQEVDQVYHHSNYIIKEGKIVHKNLDAKYFNYITQFTYIKAFKTGNITQQQLQKNLGLILNCGRYSYAKILKKFKNIFGVTGTLDFLLDTQKSVLVNSYKINGLTLLPSVFGESMLKFNKKDKCGVHVEEDRTHYQQIRRQIDAGLLGTNNGSRACLVFFEDEESLLKFHRSHVMTDMKDTVQILTEEASLSLAQNIIKKATLAGQVTLATRSFGRGTDFLIRDEIVIKNGGLCTIQTFPSVDPSEQIQIQGRSARMGQPGSYVLVVRDSQLEEFQRDTAERGDRMEEILSGKHEEQKESAFGNFLKQQPQEQEDRLFNAIQALCSERYNVAQSKLNEKEEKESKAKIYDKSEDFSKVLFGSLVPNKYKSDEEKHRELVEAYLDLIKE